MPRGRFQNGVEVPTGAEIGAVLGGGGGPAGGGGGGAAAATTEAPVGIAIDEPHTLQNRAPSGFSCPFGQRTIINPPRPRLTCV